jgi:hypothetical protein
LPRCDKNFFYGILIFNEKFKSNQNFFYNFFMVQIKGLWTGKNSQKSFFDLWGLCTGTKDEKVGLFGISTCTKVEFRIFEE